MTKDVEEFKASLLSTGGVTNTQQSFDWLRTFQSDAKELTLQQRLPTTSDEEWRFTDLKSLYKTPLSFHSEHPRIDSSVVSSFRIPEATRNIVLVNGVYSHALSLNPECDGLSVRNLADCYSHPEAMQVIKDNFGEINREELNVFQAMNSASFQDVIVVQVDSISDEEIIHLLNISTGKHTCNHPRVMVLAKQDTKVCLLEDHVGIGGYGYLSNSVTTLALERGAEVVHVKLQREEDTAYHIAQTNVELESDANYKNWSIGVGAAVSRHNILVKQMQPSGHVQIRGLAIGNSNRVVDTHSCVEHMCPHGVSDQIHKTIAKDRSKVVFNGKIKVHKDAQRTNASQQNRNLILDPRASVDAKPELEIFADDVKCAHGATVGQVSDEQLFYMRTRGIDESAARNLLNFAFAREVIEDLPAKSLGGVIESYIREQTGS